MRQTPLSYAADGLTLTGYFADGSGGRPAPGILVAHPAPGLSERMRETARQLAERGYVAFALDMYGAEGFPRSETMHRHEALISTPGAMFRRAKAALDLLASQPNVDPHRLAAMGFCQGGVTALELARGQAPIRCAVGFHPGLGRAAGAGAGPIAAKVLMLVGDDDPLAPAEDRAVFAAEMKAAGADWQLVTFGGVGHSYTNPEIDALGMPGYAYSEAATRRSWAMMLALFDETF